LSRDLPIAYDAVTLATFGVGFGFGLWAGLVRSTLPWHMLVVGLDEELITGRPMPLPRPFVAL